MGGVPTNHHDPVPGPASDGRRVGGLVALTGLAGCVVLAWWWVPWQPVPGGMPDPVPAESVFSAAEIARAEAYSGGARLLGWAALATSIAVVALIGFTGRGRRLVVPDRGPWWWRAAAAVVVVQLVVRMATLPWSWAVRRRRLEFGLTTQTPAGWLRDVALGFAVQSVVAVLAVLVIVGLARRWPRAWSAIAAGVLLGATMAASFVYPVLVEPLFNRFEALPEGPVRAAVLALAEAEGVRVDDVLVADASRRTTSLNAYVSGFGATRRVVLYDTLVEEVPVDQLEAVVAHELAHAVKHDVLVGSLLGGLAVVCGVGLAGVLCSARSRAPTPDAVPLLLALWAIALLAAAPVQSTISRQFEARADVVAVRATGDGAGAEALQRSLALAALSDPTPPRWAQLWFGSHPTALERIAIARRY